MEQRLLTHRTAAVSPGALVITGTHREQLDQCGDTLGGIGTHWRHTGQGRGPLLGSCHLVISPHTAPGHHPLGAG